MQRMRSAAVIDSRKIHMLHVDEIVPNPAQPRRFFDVDSLQSLADSIRQYGVLQPISVRKIARGYELIAGERRLRAARLAGLAKIPCLLVHTDDKSSALVALIENLQRCDLDFFEEAEGIARLIDGFGLSQEEAALRLGKSQSAVANKLRLLKHPPAVVAAIRANRLTERHARALLRLENIDQRMEALQQIIENQWTVAQTDQYIDKLCEHKDGIRAKKQMVVIKDVRIFFNTVNRAVSMFQSSGLQAAINRSDTDDNFVLTVTIPKKS